MTWLGYLKRRNIKKILRSNTMLELDNIIAVKSETAPRLNKNPFRGHFDPIFSHNFDLQTKITQEKTNLWIRIFVPTITKMPQKPRNPCLCHFETLKEYVGHFHWYLRNDNFFSIILITKMCQKCKYCSGGFKNHPPYGRGLINKLKFWVNSRLSICSLAEVIFCRVN